MNMNSPESWTPERRAAHKEKIKKAMAEFKDNLEEVNTAVAEGAIPRVDVRVGHRPTKLTPRVKSIILDGLRKGNYLYTVFEAAGIHYTTYTSWLARGKEGEEPFASFYKDVKKAMAESEMSLVNTIETASQKEWTAAAWLLERRMPEKFGKRDNVTINDGKALEINVNEEKKLEIIAKIEAVASRVSIGNKDEDTTVRPIEHHTEDSTDVGREEERVLQLSE